MKKVFLSLICTILVANCCFAKDVLQFNFPNDGWHKVASPDGIESKKCYVPYNQSSDNYTEMLIFTEKIVKNEGLAPMVILQKQLGKDKTNYLDIKPEYILQDIENTMVTWCSAYKNTCAIERAFRGDEGIVLVTYINKAPHYSQNMFGQWSNILSAIKVHTRGVNSNSSLIELD